jgi:precorrin-6B methylase 2
MARVVTPSATCRARAAFRGHALSPKPAEVIFDIGCGAGQTVLQLAQRVEPGGQIIPISKTVLATRVECTNQIAASEPISMLGSQAHSG